jgi:hypothetical protein
VNSIPKPIADLIRSAFSPEGADLGDGVRLKLPQPFVLEAVKPATVTKRLAKILPPIVGRATEIVVTASEVRIVIKGLPDKVIPLDSKGASRGRK